MSWTPDQADLAPTRTEPVTVLVVDDDADIREILIEILDEQGYRTTGATNGAEALALLAAEPLPRMILLDLSMPVMNGFDFRKAQRMDPRLADIPTVVISASGDVDARVRPLEVQGVLKKPIAFDQLLATTARWAR